eukprot:scaffold175140_cov18-Prasinocladus_malaysianus.AAC.2
MAAAAIANLAQCPAIRESIQEAGGIAALVRAVKHPPSESQVTRATHSSISPGLCLDCTLALLLLLEICGLIGRPLFCGAVLMQKRAMGKTMLGGCLAFTFFDI